MTVLSADELAVGYGATVVARGIRLAVRQGSVTCLLGPNGVGKTTLFKTLMGLIKPLAGSIRLGTDALADLSRPAIARRMAFVPQTYAGAFAYTVLDLVVMGRTAHLGAFGVPGAADRAIAADALAALGIGALASRDASRISGGQRQLALIARALAQQAGLIVMDEPTASLDLRNRALVLDQIAGLAGRGLAVLLSTHEPEHAFAVADTVVTLGGDPAFLAGPPASVLTSARLSSLYGVDLQVERTPSGRLVVARGAR